MKSHILAMMVLGLVACTAKPMTIRVNPEPTNYAWWLRTDFYPHGLSFRSIPVREIDRTWCSIDELNKSIFPNPIEPDSSDWEPTSDRASYHSTIEIDGRPTPLALAIYRTCNGSTGTALVAFDQIGPRRYRLVASLPLVSPASWATIEKTSPSSVRIYSCFECDSFIDVAWNPQTRTLIEVPTDDDRAITGGT